MNQPQSLFETAPRYVRVTSWRDDGYVEFDFLLGDADLAVELIMNRAMFDAFCQVNQVQPLDCADRRIERSRERWRFDA